MAPNMHTLFSEADKLETWARQKGLTHDVNLVHLAWKIHLQGCLFIVCRWGTIFGSNWCWRFGFETDRGRLTGLDVQIKSPVRGGWGGAASVSREETHLLTLQLGWGSGGQAPCIASWQTGCGCGRQKVVRQRVLAILLHRGRPVITSSSSDAEPNPQLGSERALSCTDSQDQGFKCGELACCSLFRDRDPILATDLSDRRSWFASC